MIWYIQPTKQVIAPFWGSIFFFSSCWMEVPNVPIVSEGGAPVVGVDVWEEVYGALTERGGNLVMLAIQRQYPRTILIYYLHP